MSLLKKIRKTRFAMILIAKAIAGYVHLVYLTSRKTYYNKDIGQKLFDDKLPFVSVFWHSRILMMLKMWKSYDRKCYILISSHSDGEFIRRAARSFHYECVAGSSNRQGAKAVRSMLDVLEAQNAVAMTPDGPRGPRYKSKPSPVALARMAGVDIYPLAYSAKRGIFLRSWDRFLLPFPFNSLVFIYGEPIRVAGSNKSDEELTKELEDRMNALTRRADIMCGWDKDYQAELEVPEGVAEGERVT